MDFRLAPFAISTWLAAALTIGLLGLSNPIWSWVIFTGVVLLVLILLRHFQTKLIDSKLINSYDGIADTDADLGSDMVVSNSTTTIQIF